MNYKREIGILLLIIGVFIIIQKSLITGAVIGATTIKEIWFFIGLGLIIGGSVLIYLSKQGKLEKITTKQFKKDTKKYNPKEIQKAIDKIGTGLGEEEKLKYLPGYSIRTSKGGRILFDYEDNKSKVILRGYDPSGKHYRNR